MIKPEIDFVDPDDGGGGGELPTGYSIYYHINGYGTQPGTRYYQTALPNPLPTLTDSRAVFVGWYTDSSLTTPAVAGATISADTYLYAKWVLSTWSGYFLVDIDTIETTMFHCPGCDSFADYINKVNIPKYNNYGVIDPDGTFICISDILTQHDLLDQYKNNIKDYYPNYQSNNEPAIVGLMKANRDGCGGTSVGYVDLPYYHTNAQGTSVQISPILAGTMPKFNLKCSLTTPGTYTLKVENGKLVCGNDTVGYTQIDAEDSSHIPMQVLVVMQGAGGGGGGGWGFSVIFYGGCGGGSGGACVALLNLAEGQEWTLTVGAGGRGGGGGEINLSNFAGSGSSGGDTMISDGTSWIKCTGGKGGGPGSSNNSEWVGGTGGGTSGSGISILGSVNGTKGASGAKDTAGQTKTTGSISAKTINFGHTLFAHSSYSQPARAAITNDMQAGAPSFHSDGTPQNTETAGYGAGGCGGNASPVTAKDGIKGGDGFIKIYY